MYGHLRAEHQRHLSNSNLDLTATLLQREILWNSNWETLDKEFALEALESIHQYTTGIDTRVTTTTLYNHSRLVP